jgi:uncharacterized membrane protein (DUF485 family)
MNLAAVSRERWRVAIALSSVVIVLYFGFILLVAFAKPWLGQTLAPGLSVGILLGALVIVASWLVTLLYVRWANRHLDARIDALKRRGSEP